MRSSSGSFKISNGVNLWRPDRPALPLTAANPAIGWAHTPTTITTGLCVGNSRNGSRRGGRILPVGSRRPTGSHSCL
jgi:hypothetical protein